MQSWFEKPIIFIALFIAFNIFLFSIFSTTSILIQENQNLQAIVILALFLSITSSFFSTIAICFFLGKNFPLEKKMTLVFFGTLIFSMILLFFNLTGLFLLSEQEWEQLFLGKVFESEEEFSFEEFKTSTFNESFLNFFQFFFINLGFAFIGLIAQNFLFKQKQLVQ